MKELVSDSHSVTATGFLKEALDTINSRASQRDSPQGERAMKATVGIFNAWTGNQITEEQGWQFMLALKMARMTQGNYNPDDYVDLIGYSALLAECTSGTNHEKIHQ